MKTLKYIGGSFLVVLCVFLVVFTLVFPLDTRLNVTYEAKYEEGNMIRVEKVQASYPLAGSPDTISFAVFIAIVSVPAVVAGILLKQLDKDSRSSLIGFLGLAFGVFLLIHIDQISAMIYSAAGTRPGDLVGFRILAVSSIAQLLWDIETFTILHLIRPIPGGEYLELLLPIGGALLGWYFGRKRVSIP